MLVRDVKRSADMTLHKIW